MGSPYPVTSVDDMLRIIGTGAAGARGADPVLPPAELPYLQRSSDIDVLNDIAGGIGSGANAVGRGIGSAVNFFAPDQIPAEMPPATAMAPPGIMPPVTPRNPNAPPPMGQGVAPHPPRAAAPPSQGETLRRPGVTDRPGTQPTEGGLTSQSRAAAPPQIPAWMRTGGQPRERFAPTQDQADAQGSAFDRLAGGLGSGDTLSSVLPGSMANVLSDLGFQDIQNERQAGENAASKLALEGAQTGQAMEDLTGATGRQIRAASMEDILGDLMPADATSSIRAWGPASEGSKIIDSPAIGQKPAGGMSVGDVKAMDRVVAGQQGKLAGLSEDRASRQSALQVVSDLQHEKGLIQAAYAAKTISKDEAEARWRTAKQLSDRKLQVLSGGKGFLDEYRPAGGMPAENSVFGPEAVTEPVAGR